MVHPTFQQRSERRDCTLVLSLLSGWGRPRTLQKVGEGWRADWVPGRPPSQFWLMKNEYAHDGLVLSARSSSSCSMQV